MVFPHSWQNLDLFFGGLLGQANATARAGASREPLLGFSFGAGGLELLQHVHLALDVGLQHGFVLHSLRQVRFEGKRRFRWPVLIWRSRCSPYAAAHARWSGERGLFLSGFAYANWGPAEETALAGLPSKIWSRSRRAGTRSETFMNGQVGLGGLDGKGS